MNTKKLLSAAASIITAGALIVSGTMAYFTSTDNSTGNTLGAGTLAIELQDLAGEPIDGPIFDEEDSDNMFPGGPSVFACAAVANVGTLGFNWSIKGVETSTTTPSLSGALWGKTYEWEGVGDPVCDEEAEGWTLIGGDIFPNGLPIAPLLDVEGPQGLLAAANKKYYMWEYYLPSNVGNEYQGASTTLTFEVKAYQTNDPAYDAL